MAMADLTGHHFRRHGVAGSLPDHVSLPRCGRGPRPRNKPSRGVLVYASEWFEWAGSGCWPLRCSLERTLLPRSATGAAWTRARMSIRHGGR